LYRNGINPRKGCNDDESLEEQSNRIPGIGSIFSCAWTDRPCTKQSVWCMRLIGMGNIDTERKCNECGIVTILDSNLNICFDCWSTLEVRIAEEE